MIINATGTVHAYALGVIFAYLSILVPAVAWLAVIGMSRLREGVAWHLAPGHRSGYTPRHAAWTDPEDDGGTAWVMGMGEVAA